MMRAAISPRLAIRILLNIGASSPSPRLCCRRGDAELMALARAREQSPLRRGRLVEALRAGSIAGALGTMEASCFIRANTKLMPVALVPEVHLHLAEESLPIWQKTEEELGRMNVPPPYWAFAWAGGQALARYLLDNPAVVAGRRVLGLASWPSPPQRRVRHTFWQPTSMPMPWLPSASTPGRTASRSAQRPTMCWLGRRPPSMSC